MPAGNEKAAGPPLIGPAAYVTSDAIQRMSDTTTLLEPTNGINIIAGVRQSGESGFRGGPEALRQDGGIPLLMRESLTARPSENRGDAKAERVPDIAHIATPLG